MRSRSRCTALVLALVGCRGSAPAAEDGPGTDGSAATGDAEATGVDDGGSDESGFVDGEDGAEIVSATLPTVLACGDGFAAEVVVRNVGASTWTSAEGFALGAVDDGDALNGPGRVMLPADASIAPGDTHAFAFELSAPTAPELVTTDWRMVHEDVRWFGEVAQADVDVSCEPDVRGGPVRLEGRSFADDGGPFVALGATMMWAAWGYRNDRPRLEQNLQWLSEHGYHYIRALGVVGDPNGEDYWDGREIELGWPDYADVIGGLTELAFDQYGLRVEWTLIGDGQVSVPTPEDRDALRDVFVALGEARPAAILHFELANESWQNGFGGDEGLVELRTRTADLMGRTDVLVAASAPPEDTCAMMQATYADGISDIATVHISRDLGQIEGPWRPVWIPWLLHDCPGLPPATNNEPIGPGASVAMEDDPERLAAAALASWISGMPGHVFHSSAGVRGDANLFEMAGIGELVHVTELVDGDVASWTRYEASDPAGPLKIYAETGGGLVPDATWPETPDATEGVVRLLVAQQGERFVALAVGILGTAVIEARRDLQIEVVAPRTGMVVDARALAAGESFEIGGAGALLLRGGPP